MNDFAPAALLEIDLNAVAANWRLLAASHAGFTAGVIKADGYGLGAGYVATALYDTGCRNFFTAHLSEAVAVRRLIPQAMVAVLNGLLPGEEAEYVAKNVVPVLGSLAEIALWRAEAARLGRVLTAIIHVDTGMARLGLSLQDAQALQDDPSLLDGIVVAYVMTHLVSADAPGDPMNERQRLRFEEMRRYFPPALLTSLANSSGMFLGPGFASDLARPGAALYGVNPTPEQKNPMRPVVRLKARILQVHDVEPGETVGYNGYWTAMRPSRIATLGVGYADGYLRSLSNRGTAIFDAAPVPLVGRVSMDLITFDVTDTRAQTGEMLELIGPGHDLDALAIEAGTNAYEILTSLGRRYTRQYSGNISGV